MTSEHPSFEFDVVVRVRRRIHLSGPSDREAARLVVKSLVSPSGLGFGPFLKLDECGHPIEEVLDNDFTIDDPAQK